MSTASSGLLQVAYLTEQISHHLQHITLSGIDQISIQVLSSLRVASGTMNKGLFVNIDDGPGQVSATTSPTLSHMSMGCCVVDAANYARSLNHQGISFKMVDKKALTTKAFVAQIEVIMETQMARHVALVDPLYTRARPQYQHAYKVEDADVLRDAIKLTFS